MAKTPSDIPLLALLLNVKTRHCIFHIGAYVKWTARRICDEADTGGVDDLSVKSSFMLDNRAVDDVATACIMATAVMEPIPVVLMNRM